MFYEMCGANSLQNVVIVTTMWDKVTEKEGSQHEEELKSEDGLFKSWMDAGQATMMRHERTANTANKVVNHFLAKDATKPRIIYELVEEQKTLIETAAGRELHNEINGFIESSQKNIESLAADVQKQFADVQKELAEESKKMARLSKELEELKRGVVVASISTLIGPWCVSLTNTYIQL